MDGLSNHYPIPAELIIGKSQVKFKFVPKEQVNGSYGVLRTMKPIEE
ncbi:hypothetical protein [Paenibacillus algorifonticola]|nr:hypothetical protein [Paenibacillus algorifonticola]